LLQLICNVQRTGMIMHKYVTKIKRLSIALICFLASCTNNREAEMAEDLLEGLRSLGLEEPRDALSVHNKLYAQAIELEKRQGAKKLNLNRVIGSLALRRAMLAEVIGRTDEVQPSLDEAVERLRRGGLLGDDVAHSQRDHPLENLILTTLEIEKPKWKDSLFQVWIEKEILSKSAGKSDRQK